MRRAAIIYAVTLAACLMGLWAILAKGASLSAPPYVAGRWLLTPLGASPDTAPIEAVIEQSGRFVRLAWDDDRFRDYRLVESTEGAPAALTGADGELRLVRPAADGRPWTIERRATGMAEPISYEARRFEADRAGRGGVAAAVSGPATPAHPFLVLLAQLAVILVVGRALGLLATRLRQPRVIGEMVAGLLLGPSLLGWLLPSVSAALFPASSIPTLGLLAELGVVFFLFIVGLELNPQLLRHRGSAAAAISHASISAPLLLGGTVHGVLKEALRDVAILVDRGVPDSPRALLVPYLGSDDDRLALEIASTIAQSCGAAVTVLHVVPPRGEAPSATRERLHAKVVTERVFSDPSQPGAVSFKVVQSTDPVATALAHSAGHDLILIGATEQWGLASQRFGWRAEPMARESGTSMLIVRRARERADR